MGYCTVSVSSALLYRRKHCKLPTPSIQRNLRELRNTHNSIGHYNTSNCIIIQILAKVRSSPRTVRVTRTSTEPNKFRATHSYSAVSSFWALLSRREPLFSVVMRSLPNRGRPWRDHSMTGTGSPSAWQFSTTVEPASTTVSTGSTVMVGEPMDR